MECQPALAHHHAMKRKPYRKSAGTPAARHFIAEWRLHRGLTQEELGAKVGKSPSNISQIETGKQGYTQALLEDIARALDADPASLLTRRPTDPDGIWNIWDRIPAAERARAIEVLKALSKSE